MSEFIFKRDESDTVDNKVGIYNKGNLVNYKPDGWSNSPNWIQSKYPVKFVVVKCPDISMEKAEIIASKRYRYSISMSDVDEIIAAGGIVTRTEDQLLAALIDHQES